MTAGNPSERTVSGQIAGQPESTPGGDEKPQPELINPEIQEEE